MKVTKRQLKRIIKEERTALMKEGYPQTAETDALEFAIDDYIKSRVLNDDEDDPAVLKSELMDVLDTAIDNATFGSDWIDKSRYR
jgi:hypothetical protein